MTILVTGGTGQVGSQVLRELAERSAKGAAVDVRVLTKAPGNAALPEGMKAVRGEFLDVPAMREALAGVSTLFLLNGVAADELTLALLTLSLAKEARVANVVYFSMLNADKFETVPHAAAKFAVERMIAQAGFAATILRPSYFMQNEAMYKDALLNGVYPVPVGSLGLQPADIRDIAAVAAIELLKRERSAAALPNDMIEIVGPDTMTGEALAVVWSRVMGKTVRYGGDDLAAFEVQTAKAVPAWIAYDVSLMFGGFQQHGMHGDEGALEKVTGALGHTPRNYQDFARELAKSWNVGQ